MIAVLRDETRIAVHIHFHEIENELLPYLLGDAMDHVAQMTITAGDNGYAKMIHGLSVGRNERILLYHTLRSEHHLARCEERCSLS